MTPLEILLVDDREARGALVAESLRAGGVDAMIERVDAEQAFRDALGERSWDAVLAAYDVATGFGAAQALRVVAEEGRALPFLVLAPSPCPAEALDLLRQGADDVVSPAEAVRLASALRRALAEAEGRRARREAERRARIMRLAVDHAPVAVLVTDRAGIIEYVNPRFQTLTGWTEDDVLGRTPGILKSGYTPPESYEALWRSITAGEEWRGEFLNRTRDGDLFWAAATIAPVRDEEGRITHFVAVEEDVTMRKLYEERLFRQANYDELTGLPNRTLLADRLVEALRAKRAGIAVLAVDLDDFKRINESLGHGAGDAILREASARLVEAVGPSGVVARLGDDDYAVLLPGIEGPDDAGTIAGLVIEAFRRPYKAGQGEAVVTASVGVAVAPGDGDEANRLLGSATMAMVMAKKQGGDRFRFFSADMEKRARRRFEVESQLRRALARGELELALQPIHSIADRRMAGVEALIRWDSPVLGRVPPEGFIPLAETSGLIEPIGAWVLEEACRQVAHLCDAGHDLFVAVNVSPAQFGSGTLPQAIETALTKSGLPPRSLEIEITESLLLVETPALAGIMAELTRLGVRLSLDDFGTGYSSLAYLRRWPFETLKIDRSFVSDVIASRDAAVLVEAVIAMAHRLNLRVVAEGVETRAQLDFLADRRCDLAQGHLLGRPDDWRAVLAALDGEAFSP